MDLKPPAGIVKWYNTPLGERGWNSFRAQLTGKDYPGTSRKTSYVKLSEKEADEVISNIKKDPEGIPLFDEANAPDKAEEYQKWLVARYLTKPREEEFKNKTSETSSEVNGGSSSVALATVPKKPDDLVEEEIDSRILSIIGLEDVFDLTYEEYARELRTAAAAGRLSDSKMSSDSIELVTEEFKRVKSKTGRFKVKPKKVDINKVLDRKQPTPAGAIVKAQKLLPPTSDIIPDQGEQVQVDNKKVQEELLSGIRKILESVITIKTLLQNQSKQEQKDAELDRRSKEKTKKKEREGKLESKRSSGIFDKAIEKVQKPFVSFFDRVKQFFLSILAGGAIDFLLNVINDPQILLKPLQDLVNNIIGFFNNIITWIDNTLIQPLRNVITSINNSLKSFIDGVNNNLSRIPSWIYRHTPIQAPQLPNIPNLPRIPLATFAQPVQTQTTGGQVVHVNQISFKGGGPITPQSGIRIDGLGKDTQLVAAQPGEVVINKAAADSVGVENLLTLNSFYGGPGANKPGMAALGDIQTMSSGGYAGKIKYFSSNGGGNKILNPGQTYKYSDLRAHHSGSNSRRTDGYPRDYTLLHGTNLASSPNADIPIPLDSEVIFKAPAGGYGNTVVVKNQTGNMLFGHLSKFGNFKVGDKIKAGTIIGTQGKTGGNYEDHLHIDAEPAGHEAFVNFITSGKPTFGSTSSSSGQSPSESSSDMEVTPSFELQFDPNYRDPNFVPLSQLKQLEGANQTIGASSMMQNMIPNNSATVSTPGQSPVPSFSSEDPLNVTNLVIRSIYNLIG